MIFTTLILVTLTVGDVWGQNSNSHPYSDKVINLLQEHSPSVKWEQSSVLMADFDEDGKQDYALKGSEDGKYIVGIIKGPLKPSSEYWILKFSVGKKGRDSLAICTLDVKIRTESVAVVGDNQGLWKIPKNSRGIGIYDDCDELRIYWDQEKKKFDWIRTIVML